MKIKPGVYFLIALVLLSLVFGIYSLSYPEIKTKLLPSVASGLVFLLAVVQLGREFKEARKKPLKVEAKTEKKETEHRAGLRGNLGGFAWMAGVIFSIYLIGFLVTIPLFVLVYLKLKGKSWFMSLVQAVASELIAYLFFVMVLGVDLYPGLFFGGH